MSHKEALMRISGVGKAYSGTRVLSDVSFDIEPGQIVGLVGENGAGKTTLLRILFGMTVIAETGGYEGSIIWKGQEVHFRSPFDALDAGIGMVHQEFSLIPGFSTTENILLNRESVKSNFFVDLFGSRMSVLDRAMMGQRSKKAIATLGVPLDPDMLIREMPIGHRQFTEIAREIDREHAALLILDEPTAVLTESEAETLLSAMRALAAKGIAILFISHRLNEILGVCDKIVVLRDGSMIREMPAQGSSVREIAGLMVGRTMEAAATTRPPQERPRGDHILEVEHLWVDMPGETVRDVSFEVSKGEILGIGGLAGQGKLGIANGIMGLYPAGGTLRFKGRQLALGSPKLMLDSGLAFVSEDRRGVGLLLDEGIDWNIGFSALQIKGSAIKPLLGGLFKWRSDAALRQLALEYIDSLEIKCTGPSQKAGTLSGGNQQKVCLAKAFALKPELLFVSEPTRGIDIGAKRIVLDTLRHYNREYGSTIVMVSSELEELRAICDRIAIVDEGSVVGTLPPETPLPEFGVLLSGARDAARIAAGDGATAAVPGLHEQGGIA